MFSNTKRVITDVRLGRADVRTARDAAVKSYAEHDRRCDARLTQCELSGNCRVGKAVASLAELSRPKPMTAKGGVAMHCYKFWRDESLLLL
ncbi:unnamed protein product [Danaus chrysippus]|uniref:(African queen) hypothetical protein n=1 Tax=Danaus chrysippus TaxID=151541 RepID=A0A8J2Q5Q6_9NEOP|nr:unnamed protein product [Danaus chrysippus]